MARTVFMGTPEFAAPILSGLIDERYEIAAVYTRPDAPAGRGRALAASPVKQLAERHGLTVVQPRSLKKPEAQEELRQFAPDVIVVAAYGLILPLAVLDIPRLACVNVHASLLPKHRGAAPISAAIRAGDEFSGVSIMRMDVGIDTGAVYSRSMIPILDWDTTGTLTKNLAIIGSMALLDVLPQLIKGTIDAAPQPSEGSSYAPMLSKEAGRIDWSKSAIEIWRQVRAYQPWPGAFTSWESKLIKLIETIPLSVKPSAVSGTVIGLSGEASAIGIATGEGVLSIKKLQIEGKKPMTGEEFLRGARGFIGSVLD
ncbi:methionyl-tRNA formyltransferase [Dehalogenimonas etheniformans]|uniref:Methionyl-tRNA formyltransferase n=1 Tax=Dehalogenimonas etheniformans TaxID=1536648 RepID=A0A2P5P6F3_9CHLR|nr:methionyl-tRNA formyltransferase [Dehalogenimonas etheniformans]PPD57874.1 methionyl-tRNA formyltransferase [Dehalogenimonas etheniformans]QNT75473.1 methionyl-tRNA formyltransferase [Dehalogenimonas etheniformans]